MKPNPAVMGRSPCGRGLQVRQPATLELRSNLIYSTLLSSPLLVCSLLLSVPLCSTPLADRESCCMPHDAPLSPSESSQTKHLIWRRARGNWGIFLFPYFSRSGWHFFLLFFCLFSLIEQFCLHGCIVKKHVCSTIVLRMFTVTKQTR